MKLWWAVPPPCMSVVLVNSSLSHPLRVSFIHTHASFLSLFNGVFSFKANTLQRLKAVHCRQNDKDYSISKIQFDLFLYIIWCFWGCTPKLWNTLPMDLRSVDIFENMRTTHLFTPAFVWFDYYHFVFVVLYFIVKYFVTSKCDIYINKFWLCFSTSLLHLLGRIYFDFSKCNRI